MAEDKQVPGTEQAPGKYWEYPYGTAPGPTMRSAAPPYREYPYGAGARSSATTEHSYEVDQDGNPHGGRVRGPGLHIDWQRDPGVSYDEAQVEDVLRAALERLRFLNTASSGKFACRQNSLAITKIEEALFWLNDRTRERKERGVEGTHQP